MEIVGGAPSTERYGTRPGLVLLYAPHFKQFQPAYALDKERGDLILGRDADAAIHIPESAVSRRHARIRAHSESFILKDLGGKNGTIVDGRFVSEIELEPLHEIRIGDAIFKFVESGAEHYARYRIDGTVLGEDTPERRTARKLVGGYQIERVASALERVAKVPMSVVLLGETGTGKELFADLLHEASGRKGPLVAINCAALPPQLVESELFGFRRGAFTGADRDKAGLVRAADGGTLFLDEIGDLPLEAQAKLLRLLESKELIPLGASAAEHVDVRVVSATHRDLGRLRREGRFRDDLFARLNEHSVVLPPLRERKEDIYSLARAFLAQNGGGHLALGFSFVVGLLHHDWPFNVRELLACIKRAIALCEGAELGGEHLPDELAENMRDYARREDLAARRPALAGIGVIDSALGPGPTEVELRGLFKLHRGNMSAIARELGRDRMQVHRWARRYGIVIEDYR
jgi:transcriptional regulator with PAS, ATPase and Fis domain